ncbi:hypothetical protein CW304_09365 [Bacillus sp. UFRGS-B20]|nr:hypothetical protein CW304_09365 [Bacillus sp. UFRGS-B20]
MFILIFKSEVNTNDKQRYQGAQKSSVNSIWKHPNSAHEKSAKIGKHFHKTHQRKKQKKR